MKNPEIVEASQLLESIFAKMFGVPLQVQFWRDGQVHFVMSADQAKAVSEAWESRGRGRPQGDQADQAA